MINRPAFTLIELLLATALSSVLMLGILAVISNTKAITPQPNDPESTTNRTVDTLARLISDDLELATYAAMNDDGSLTITSLSSIHPTTNQRTHRPVAITYAIEPIGSRPWLIRRQSALDVLTNQNTHRELVCANIARIEIQGIDAFASDAPTNQNNSTDPNQSAVDQSGQSAQTITQPELIDGLPAHIWYFDHNQTPPPIATPNTANSKHISPDTSLSEQAAGTTAESNLLPPQPTNEVVTHTTPVRAAPIAVRLLVWLDSHTAEPHHNRFLLTR